MEMTFKTRFADLYFYPKAPYISSLYYNFTIVTANTEMIWFQQPDSNPLGQAWKPTVINRDICGTFQYGMTFDIPGEGPKYALFTVGYFTHILAVHWSTAADDSWLNLADVRIINSN